MNLNELKSRLSVSVQRGRSSHLVRVRFLDQILQDAYLRGQQAMRERAAEEIETNITRYKGKIEYDDHASIAAYDIKKQVLALPLLPLDKETEK